MQPSEKKIPNNKTAVFCEEHTKQVEGCTRTTCDANKWLLIMEATPLF